MKKFVAIILTICAIACLFAGCGNPRSTEPQSLALVISARQNFSQLSFDKNSDAFKSNEHVCQNVFDAVGDAMYSYGSATAITVESNPQISAETSLNKPDALIDNSKRKQLARKAAKAFFEEWNENGQATSAEADTLNALTRATNAVKGNENAPEKRIIVLDSGLSTSGYLNFTKEDILETDTQIIIERLLAYKAIPDMSGTSLVWYGMSSVSGSQAQIPAEYEHKLYDIWSAILDKTGADYKIVSTPLKEVAPAEGLPHVTAIPMPSADIGSFAGGYKKISSVNFEPDSARIIDEKGVLDSLSDVINAMNCTSTNIIIAGSCASVGDGMQLSLDRANAIRDLLCSTGVDPSHIKTVGLGRKAWSKRVNDLNSDGRLIEEEAVKNRAVYICSSTSDLAKEINALVSA